MASSFASRLSGLREKKISIAQNQQGNLKLTLPPDQSDKSGYEPTTSFNNTRTSFRLLKGRIDRTSSTQKTEFTSNHAFNDSKGLAQTQKLNLEQETPMNLKLVLNDQPVFEQKKTIVQPPKIPIQKRILIQKEPPKQEEIKRPQVKQEEKRVEQKKIEQKQEQTKRQMPPLPNSNSQKMMPAQQRPIREQQAEQSLPPESQNDLVLCPEGCGRKFNRKALEKHAKACKLVFMSKRKQFNSEATRITSKEQAQIIKQTKIQQKRKMGSTKGKGFDKMKTGENWKAASEDFRAAVKAMKKQEKEEKEEQIENIDLENVLKDNKVIKVSCEYCEKEFSEVFFEKHLENCLKKKEKERKRPSVKK